MPEELRKLIPRLQPYRTRSYGKCMYCREWANPLTDGICSDCQEERPSVVWADAIYQGAWRQVHG